MKMRTKVLSLKHSYFNQVLMLSMLLGVLLLPLHFSAAETTTNTTTVPTSQSTRTVATEIESLRSMIIQLQARITAMQKERRSADDYVERGTTTKKPQAVASTSVPKKVTSSTTDYAITTVSNNASPLISGKAKAATTTTIIIENSVGEVVYTKENNKVTKGNWTHKVTKVLAAGSYTAILVIDGKEVAEKEFKINQPAKPTPVPDTQPTSSAATGEYRGYYSDGHNFIITKIITKADALVSCIKNAASNPTKKVYCTWNGAVIYGTKPVTTTTTTTTTNTSPTSYYSQSSYSTQSTYPSSYTSPTRYGDVRGAATTNPKEMLASILIGLVGILEALE